MVIKLMPFFRKLRSREGKLIITSVLQACSERCKGSHEAKLLMNYILLGYLTTSGITVLQWIAARKEPRSSYSQSLTDSFLATPRIPQEDVLNPCSSGWGFVRCYEATVSDLHVLGSYIVRNVETSWRHLGGFPTLQAVIAEVGLVWEEPNMGGRGCND